MLIGIKDDGSATAEIRAESPAEKLWPLVPVRLMKSMVSPAFGDGVLLKRAVDPQQLIVLGARIT